MWNSYEATLGQGANYTEKQKNTNFTWIVLDSLVVLYKLLNCKDLKDPNIRLIDKGKRQ